MNTPYALVLRSSRGISAPPFYGSARSPVENSDVAFATVRNEYVPPMTLRPPS